jgi:uncharacterized membrane protein YcaP (DUF421 family)
MLKTRIDPVDVLEAARVKHGVERMDQINYAVLERDGEISIIPRAEARGETGSEQADRRKAHASSCWTTTEPPCNSVRS